jgi:hypothetical protein
MSKFFYIAAPLIARSAYIFLLRVLQRRSSYALLNFQCANAKKGAKTYALKMLIFRVFFVKLLVREKVGKNLRGY